MGTDMIAALIAFSIRARWAVVFAVLVIAGFGLWQLTRLPIDAVPDITNNQVQVNSVDPGLSPLDMEKRVTFPIETALAGIPGLESTRSISRNGFSQVTAVFTDRTDLYFARQQVSERLAQAREELPDGVQPSIGPVTTGLGEVFMYAVDFAPRTTAARPGEAGWQADGAYLTPEGERLTDDVARGAYLRTVQDWIIIPQLRGVAGVAGVDSIGGYEKHYVVEPDPARMASYGVSFTDLATALEASNLSVGANFLNRGGEAYLVRADARIQNLDQIAQTVVATHGGAPVAVKDVATVKLGGELRTGAASMNGREVVIGTVLMRIGENSRTVAKASGAKLAEIQRALPPGIVAKAVLDRSILVGRTIGTVERNLAEGALLTALALFFLLGNVRAAAIAVLVIPLSFLMMAIGMNGLKVSGNLMSLGALDFGLIVDGAVIIIENGLARLAARQHRQGRALTLPERLEEVLAAAKETIRPTVFGQAIIFLVFLPLLTFTGVEGATFSPMAIALMLALAAAFALSLTFVPAMLALLIRGPVSEKKVWLIGKIETLYRPWLERAVARPTPFIAAGVGLFVAALFVFTLLGREFIPTLDEGDIATEGRRVASVSLDQSQAMQMSVEKVIATIPEVRAVFAKTGTAEMASDPMPPNSSDTFILLKPKEEWPDPSMTKDELLEKIEARLAPLIGNGFEFNQPIQLRFNELIAGVRGDVAVKIYGDDLEKMTEAGERIASVLRGVRGAADVKVEQTGGAPILDVAFDRAAIARYGLSVEEVADTIAAAMAGSEAGVVFEGDRRFDIVVRLGGEGRADVDALKALPVMLPNEGGALRASVPLGQLASFTFTEGVNQISRENGKRRVVVQANVRGRDIGSFVGEAEDKVDPVRLPTGAYLEWGGQFQNLKAATGRLMIIVPVCFLAIFALLYMALGAFGRALSVFTAVPLSIAGGVFTLALTGIDFSVSAAVGFICLSGVAVLNGLVVMTSIRQRLEAGEPLDHAIIEGAFARVRPVVMTGLVPAIGFLPMAIAQGAGAEVQKPLATVVIGGLITATVLTLIVLPAISRVVLGWTEGRRPASLKEAALPAE